MAVPSSVMAAPSIVDTLIRLWNKCEQKFYESSKLPYISSTHGNVQIIRQNEYMQVDIPYRLRRDDAISIAEGASAIIVCLGPQRKTFKGKKFIRMMKCALEEMDLNLILKYLIIQLSEAKISATLTSNITE